LLLSRALSLNWLHSGIMMLNIGPASDLDSIARIPHLIKVGYDLSYELDTASIGLDCGAMSF
jgi:hypothetical protein